MKAWSVWVAAVSSLSTTISSYVEAVFLKFKIDYQVTFKSLNNIYITIETAYKVAIRPSGNLLYMQIYLITDIKLLWKGVFGL